MQEQLRISCAGYRHLSHGGENVRQHAPEYPRSFVGLSFVDLVQHSIDEEDQVVDGVRELQSRLSE